jgi:NCS1 family nucleobase:cation symporter-1
MVVGQGEQTAVRTVPARHGAVEARSIDHVPAGERHGKAWHQAPFWFTGQFVVTTMIIGYVGPAQGLSLGPSIAACVLGALFGTFFMAFHATQGPATGLPQMVQSRAQFGVRGAVVPMLAAIVQYVGLAVLAVLLVPQAVTMVLPGPHAAWALVVLVLAVVLAVVGHDLLHAVLRWLPYVVVPLFAVLTVLAVLTLEPRPPAAADTAAAFLTQFVAAAAYQLGYAVYVSDYSRYLPSETPARAVVGWTYLGAAASALWLMPLGAFLASSVPVADPLANLRDLGDAWVPGFGVAAVVATLVPVGVALLGVNLYGTMLSGLGIVAAFRPIRPSVRWRVAGIVPAAVVAYAGALATPAAYLGTLNAFLTVVLYLLVPWTAVNLADFYRVRRGRYAITDLFDDRGVYGRWSARGLLAYGVGFAAMVPFMAVGSYTGPVAAAWGGVDIAAVVGLVVAGGGYLLAHRGFRAADEDAAVAASRRALAAREVERHTVDDLSVLVRPGSAGPPLLLVHPANLSADCWLSLAVELPAAQGWIAVDLRGHGRSTRRGPLDVAGWAQDCARVLAALDVPRVHAVGASAGAAVVVELAVRHPGLVASVATVGGAFRPVDPDAGALVADIRAVGPAAALRTHAETEAVAVAAVAERVVADLSDNDAATVVDIWRAAAATDVEALPGLPRCPVLAVVGELDQTCPPAESAWFAQVSGARLETLAGVGHLPMYEAPRELAALLAGFSGGRERS